MSKVEDEGLFKSISPTRSKAIVQFLFDEFDLGCLACFSRRFSNDQMDAWHTIRSHGYRAVKVGVKEI